MISRWSIRRVDTPELLDLGQGSDRDVRANLTEMQRINDLLGGTRALTRHLYPRLLAEHSSVVRGSARRGPALRVLDLGAGGAGLPQRLAAWAARRGIPIQIIAVDHSARVLAAAKLNGGGHSPPVALLLADALCLPLPPGSVDYVISSLFLHHLPPAGVVALLRRAALLARDGLIMSDLVRGRMPYLAFKAAAPLFARNYLTRIDGALSIRRAYTPAELRALAEQAGLREAKVHAHFPWRMTLVVDR